MSFEDWLKNQDIGFLDILHGLYELEQRIGPYMPLSVNVSIVSQTKPDISEEELLDFERYLNSHKTWSDKPDEA